MKVLVIETSHPKDFYNDKLDGVSTHELLKVFGVRSELRIALTEKEFVRALKRAALKKFDVVHVSCHGNTDGVAFAADRDKDPVLRWKGFAQLFDESKCSPKALVMSSCCGASSGIGEAFAKAQYRPNIVFGTTTSRYYPDYIVAWSILYRLFKREGVQRSVAQTALEQICAVIHPTFMYRRWDEDRNEYRHYPGEGESYEVVEKTRDKKHRP